jgi:hypothetical protein
MFDAFWSAYPHKVGKKAAEKKYWVVRRDVSHEAIMHGLALYKETKPAWKAWCNPMTWLHQGRWEDQPADVQSKTETVSTEPRPMPQYLRSRADDRPQETPEQVAHKKARLEAMEIMRAQGIDPWQTSLEEINRRAAEILSRARATA